MGGGGSVGADQVVHRVAIVRAPVEQGVVLQDAQGLARLCLGPPGEGGRGRQVGVRAGSYPEQREHRPLMVGEVAQGPGQHRRQASGGVGVVVEHLQTQVAQFGGELGQGDLRAGGGVAGRDGQRQRVASAQLDQLVGHVGFGVDPLVAEAPGQQGTGLGVGEYVQRHVAGIVPVDQGGQLGAAGDQHGAGRTARQQREDLVGGGGVVQHDQHLLASDQAAVQRGLGVQVWWESAGVDAEGIEERAYRVGRFGRPSGSAEPVQVDEQLPVGEPVEVAVCPREGQPGLADPAGPADRRDHHHRCPLLPAPT